MYIVEIAQKVVRRTCTAKGMHPCEGRVVRVPTLTMCGFKVKLPYCERHSLWVQGDA